MFCILARVLTSQRHSRVFNVLMPFLCVCVCTELYFGGSGITLNERFSAPQTGGYSEDKEAEELTLDRRFSSNRCVFICDSLKAGATQTAVFIFTLLTYENCMMEKLRK